MRHVRTHSAGLHRMRTLLDDAQRMLHWDYMVAALERASRAAVAVFVQEELARPLRRRAVCGARPGSAAGSRRSAPMAAPLARRLGLRPGGGDGGRRPDPGAAGGCRSARAGSITCCCHAGSRTCCGAGGDGRRRSGGERVLDRPVAGELDRAAGRRRPGRRWSGRCRRGPCSKSQWWTPAGPIVLVLPMGWRWRYHSASTTRHGAPACSVTSGSAARAGGPIRGVTWRSAMVRNRG